MTMDDHQYHNWETSELNTNNNHNHNNQVALNDAPKFKSVQPPSLPLSSSPSFHLPFSSTFSPTDFLISPFFLTSPNVKFPTLFMFFCLGK